MIRPVVLAAGAGSIATVVLASVFFTRDTDAPTTGALATTPVATIAPSPTPQPDTWLAAIAGVESSARPELISCRDRNDDLRLDDADALAGLDITLISGEANAVASAGSDLLAPREGESLGLIPIINDVRTRADREHGIASSLILSAAAVFGAEQPQTSMERWLAREIALRLDAAPCLRAVLIGHSHGGATVTSVAAALDAAYADRLLGVLIDRTTALYDRSAGEMPSRTPILNFFQLNEGWHGVPIEAANVTNFDESTERAPVAPSDGGGGDALVSHKTLDDAPNVQRRVIDGVLAWAAG